MSIGPLRDDRLALLSTLKQCDWSPAQHALDALLLLYQLEERVEPARWNPPSGAHPILRYSVHRLDRGPKPRSHQLGHDQRPCHGGGGEERGWGEPVTDRTEVLVTRPFFSPGVSTKPKGRRLPHGDGGELLGNLVQ